MGFFDIATLADATDGCWLEINSTYGINYQGTCSAASVRDVTTSNIALDSTVWYIGKIEIVNAAGTTTAVFTIQNSTGTIWQNNLTTRIPSSTQYTGFGVIAGENSTGAAAVVLNMDFMSYESNRILDRVALS
jgi:hypothetical protein